MRVRASFLLPLLTYTALAAPPTSLPLNTAKLIRSLGPEDAKRGLTVHVRGQVLTLSGWKNSFFFSDGKTGISIDRNDTLPQLHFGDEIEVFGKTAAGLFAPIIISDQIRLLHAAAPGASTLPPAPLRVYT